MNSAITKRPAKPARRELIFTREPELVDLAEFDRWADDGGRVPDE